MHGIERELWLLDNEDIIVEFLTKIESGKTKTETTKYLHGPGIDEPLEIERKGESYSYHADGLGSITALTDSRQKAMESYTYTSFGDLKRQGGKVKNTYTFTAREFDEEIELYYYRARYYGADIGRFTSFDPILHPGNGPQTKTTACGNSLLFNSTFVSSLYTPAKLNPFVYVEDNPINRTDPYGLFSFDNWSCCMFKEVKAFGGGAVLQLAECAIACGGICGAASIVSGGSLFVPCFGACLDGICGQLLRYKIQYIVPALTSAAIECAWKANNPKYCCE